MLSFFYKIDLEKIISFFIKFFFLLLPYPTILIVKEKYWGVVKWQYGTIGFYALELFLWLIIAVFLVFFVRRIKEKRENGTRVFRWTNDRLLVLSILVLNVYLFISIFWAGDQEVAYQQSLRFLSGSILFLMLIILQTKLLNYLQYFIYGSIVPSILGIWQFLNQSAIENKWLGLASHQVWQSGTSILQDDSGRWLRAYGSFNHPNIFAGFLSFSLFFSFFSLFQKKDLSQNKRILISIIAVCNIFALAFTFSRSGILSFIFLIIGLGIFSLDYIKKYYKKIILTFLMLGSCLVAINFNLIKNRLNPSSSAHESASIVERIDENKQAFGIIKGHLFSGVGFGNYTFQLHNENSNLQPYSIEPVHNIFLLIFAELGLVGVVLVLISMFFYFKIFIFKQTSRVKFSLLFIYLGLGVLAFFDHYLLTSYQGVLLAVIFLAFVQSFPTVNQQGAGQLGNFGLN